MMCARPFRRGLMEFGCGQCVMCEINKRRIWVTRLMLEQKQHEASCFVTLTFDEDHFPKNGSVHPRDLQLFMKRVRYHVDSPLRYFGVGEYGDFTFRPHYHVALFGFRPEEHVQSFRDQKCSCGICDSWRFGSVHIGDLNDASASYIAGYVGDKLRDRDNPRLEGRYPVFSRMSLKPGIGAGAIEAIADVLTSEQGSEYVASNADVSNSVRVGDNHMPLGRYLRTRVREKIGMPKKQPIQAQEKLVRKREVDIEMKGGHKKYYERRKMVRVQKERNVRSKLGISQSKKGIGL